MSEEYRQAERRLHKQAFPAECECGDKIGYRDLERQLAEAQGKLDAVRALSFDHNHNTRVFLAHCPRCQVDRILKEGK